MTSGLLLGLQAVRFAAAKEFVDTDDLRRSSWAVRLDPQNAAVYNHFGLLHQWALAETAAALPYLRRATELSPYAAAYWVDLATGCELAGQFECATQAYEKASALAPMRGEFIWDLANYYLRAGDQKNALDRFALYLRRFPSTRERTFRLLYRGIHDPQLAWEKVVHATGDPRTEVAYLTFLRRQNAQAQTGPFWNEMMAERKPVPADGVLPYVDLLLEAQDYGEAKRAWNDLQGNGTIHASRPDNELVFNGEFNEKLLNGGFDWRLLNQPFLNLGLAQAGSCRESSCLYVNFTVPQNLDFEPVYQLIPVEPHRLYSLSAFVRSLDVTSDSGPMLRVIDPQCPTCLDARTPAVIETQPWHKVETTFMTGPQTQVVKLSVFRPRRRIFPMEISGEFWLDSVSLKPASTGHAPEL